MFWSKPARDLAQVLTDTDYKLAGAEIVADADAVYGRAELVVKVKEPPRGRAQEAAPRSGAIRLSASRARPLPRLEDLLQSGVTAIAYETVTDAHGTLPLLTPMSEVAGRMAPHVGARCLGKGKRRPRRAPCRRPRRLVGERGRFSAAALPAATRL